MSGHRRLILALCLPLSVAGCAGPECLRLPVSTKISDAVVARCQLEAHQLPERRDVFDRAIRLAWARGLYEQMVSSSKWVLRHDKTRADARYYLAVGLRKLGQCDAALVHYRAYATLRPDDPDPHFGMALCYEAGGDKRGALAAFSAYLSREKRQDRRAWRDRARARMARLEQPPALEGRATLRREATTPRAATAAAGLARAPTPAARPQAPPAPADCGRHERAFKADPFATAAYDAFATCALSRKEHAKVIKTMRMAIRDNPDFARGWLQLGRAYAAAGNRSAAERALARACTAGVSEACKP